MMHNFSPYLDGGETPRQLGQFRQSLGEIAPGEERALAAAKEWTRSLRFIPELKAVQEEIDAIRQAVSET